GTSWVTRSARVVPGGRSRGSPLMVRVMLLAPGGGALESAGVEGGPGLMRLVTLKEGGDRVGGNSGQQDAVAEVAGGDDAAPVPDAADDGPVVAGARAQPGARLGED